VAAAIQSVRMPTLRSRRRRTTTTTNTNTTTTTTTILEFYAVQLVPNLRRGSRTLNTRLVGANTLS